MLGAGTAGSMLVNALTRRLDRAQWRITVVDRDDVHLSQPRLLDGELAFQWVYGHLLLPGRRLPVPDEGADRRRRLARGPRVPAADRRLGRTL